MKQSFEESLQRLEALVMQLERGEQSLEESMKLFAEGTTLVSHCQSQLKAAEMQVEVLLKSADGSEQTAAFTE